MEYISCTHPNKSNHINRFDRPYNFQSVIIAMKSIKKQLPNEEKFLKLSKNLYFGNTHYEAIPTIGGTGSYKLAMDFLSESYNEEHNTVHLPNTSNQLYSSKLPISTYDYLKNRKFDVNFLLESINKIPNDQIIVLQGNNNYNPTYNDWIKIISLCKSKNLFIIVNMMDLGLISGNIDDDKMVLNIMNSMIYPSLICTSYSKNFGLTERLGNLFFTGANNTQTQLIHDTLKRMTLPYTNSMNIVSTILDNKDLTNIWKYELNDIMNNINITRILLRSILENKLNKDFSDITSQQGMTYYSNLTIQQILEMRKHGIYIRDNGNISLTNINKMNIEYITNTWCKVIKN